MLCSTVRHKQSKLDLFTWLLSRLRWRLVLEALFSFHTARCLWRALMVGLTATRCIRQAEAVAAYKTQHGSHDQHDTSSTARPPSRIPIIAVTASALEEDANRCMQSGFDDIIHKPIDIQLLSKRMAQLTAAKRDKLERQERERDASNVEVVVSA